MYHNKKEAHLSFINSFHEGIEQASSGRQEDLAGDVPIPSLEEFLYDEDYLHLPFTVSKIQLNFLKALDDTFNDPSSCKYSQMIVIWGKGCQKKSAKILDNNNKEFTIEELVTKKLAITSKGYDEETGRVLDTNLDVPFLKGTEQLYEVLLQDNKRVEVTAGHKFLTSTGWKKLSDISRGSEVLIKDTQAPSFVKIKSIRPTTIEEIYDLESYPTQNYFANGVLHHNSGKDFIAGVAALRIINKLLCYYDPRETLRKSSGGKISIAPSDFIDILNVAVNAEQAKSVYFDKLCGLVKNAGYKAFKRFGFDYSKNVTSSTIIFPKELRIISGNSKQESLEGKNLIMAVLDEIACAHYSTKVLLSNGKSETIGKIVNNKQEVEVLTFNFEKKIFEPKRVTQFYKYPRTSPFIKIYTKGCGHKRTESVLLTPNHWVYTDKGKKQVRNLTVGDGFLRKGMFLNNFQKQFVLGTLLGTGCLAGAGSSSSYLSWTHSIKQKEYIEHKAKILGELTSGVKVTKPIRYLKTPRTHLETKHVSTFHEIEEICYDCLTKKKTVTKEWAQQLDLVSLAFWYLDAGSLQNNKKSINFSTNFYTKEECIILCTNSILNKYEPVVYTTAKGNSISINKKQNTINFLNDIKKYIPPSMAHKTIFKEEELCSPLFDSVHESFGYVPIFKLEEFIPNTPASAYVYDIGVEDNHNYLVGGAHNVISNSFKTKDELKGTKGQLSAEDMYDVLRTSINTRFPVFGKLVMISYPRHKRDFLMQFYDEAEALIEKNPNIGIYLSKAATWEANPTKSKKDKAIADDYLKNPEKAAQFYECIAPDSEDPFFRYKDKIHRMYETLEVPNPFNEVGGYSPLFRAKPYQYVIHLDLAYSGCRAAMALSHVEGEAEDRLFYCDLIKYWDASAVEEIDLSKIEEEIIFLRRRGFNIVNISYDNAALSKYLIQRIEKLGFSTSYITVDRNIAPYNSLKDLIYSEKVRTYYNRILIEELLGLSLVNGIKIDHVNCFTGDTKILLSDGREVSMKELTNEYLLGKDNYVYSFNLKSNIVETKKIKKAWKSGENTEVIKITLNNKEEIKCTPNHRFLLKTGEYKEARDLLYTDTLMSLCKDKKSKLTYTVSKIDTVNIKQDVFDLEIESNNNFALSSGVFVHNSGVGKDLSDSFCGSIYNLLVKKINISRRYFRSF